MAVEHEQFDGSVEEIMIHSIQVRISPVMNAERDDVQRAADLARLRIVKHLVLGWTEVEVIRSLLQIREVRERYGHAVFHQPRRLDFFLSSNKVQGAALIGLAPPAPIREFRLPAIHLLDGDVRMLRRFGLGLRRNSQVKERRCGKGEHSRCRSCAKKTMHNDDLRWASAWPLASRMTARTLV